MTAPTPAAPPAPESAGQAFAPWFRRVAATILDTLPVVVLFWALVAVAGDTQTTSTSASVQLDGVPFLVYLVGAVGWFAFNWLYLQGTTGQTLAKRALGIAIHRAGTTQPMGPGLTFARQLCHVVDSLPFMLGYVWPLWDRENRTFADMIVSSRAHRV